MASDSSHTPPLRSLASSSEEESQEEQRQQEERPRDQAVVAGRRVSQRAHDDPLDIDLMVASIEERGPLWDSRDPRHADQGVLRHLWIEVAQLLWDGFDSASPTGKAKFLKQLKTRWRSMKDRFKRGLKKEGQIRSGAAASRTSIYKYNRILQFLRPVLESRETHSSTRETVRPSGAVLREAPSELSQPSHSESRSAPPQSGEPAAGPSDVPLAEASVAPSFGSSRQRQRASDRAILPEFLHLSTVFQNGFKALCDKMSNIDRRLETIESELSRPAKHFFSAIQKGMVEHLTPELQISVMQACNNAYVTALQQARVMQSATTMPAVPSLAAMALTPAAEHHHRAPRAEGHHRTEPQTSAPARPSRAHRREADPHPEGERRKKKKKTTSTTTLAMAAPKTTTQSTQPGSTRSTPSTQPGSTRSTPSTQPGSTRSRSSQPRTLVVPPPPSPPALAVSPPSTGWIDVGIPSSVIEYAASSPSSSSSVSSTPTKSGGYQSPLIADIDTP
ncbi:basic-leucine zipper transcription factor A-like isoform X2 [Ranitomeya imitator]